MVWTERNTSPKDRLPFGSRCWVGATLIERVSLSYATGFPIRRLKHRPSKPVALLGNSNWRQSNERDGQGCRQRAGLGSQFKRTAADGEDAGDGAGGLRE